MNELGSLLVFVGLVAIMLAVGLGIGMLIGPRLGRFLDTVGTADTEMTVDGADGVDVDDEGPSDDD